MFIIEQLFEEIPSRDRLKISIKSLGDEDELFQLFSLDQHSKLSLERFIRSLINFDNMLQIDIQIKKKLENNTLSIYSFESFEKTMSSFTINKIMQSFSGYFNSGVKELIFEVFQDEFESFQSKTIVFKNPHDLIERGFFDRENALYKLKYMSRFYNSSEYPLLPEDFILSPGSCENNVVDEIFKKISTLLSMAYIGYETKLIDTVLSIQISSDKLLPIREEINDLNYQAGVIDLYRWIVSSDTYLDKAEVVRNTLSLNITEKFVVDTSIINLIQKIYNVAIKKNVDKYFEVKKASADLMITTINEFRGIGLKITDSFINNVFAVVAFIATTVVPSIVENKSLDKIFTTDVKLIIKIAMIGSIMFCVFNDIKTYYLFRSYDMMLEKLKKNFSDSFTSEELDKWFNGVDINIIKRNSIIFIVMVNIVWLA